MRATRDIAAGTVSTLLVVPVAPALLHGQTPPSARASQIGSPPVIDGRLDDDAWSGSFRTAVLRFNASYSFTPRVYLQANVQYNDDTKDVGTNVRFARLDTAGTGLYIVWNDTSHTGSLERTGIMAGPKQRQLVVKYSRLFNLTG